MKYGIYYAYWAKEWGGNFLPFIFKVKKLGFDVLEVNCSGFPEMEIHYLKELKQASQDEGIILTGGYGPRPEHNLSSPDPEVVKCAFKFWRETLKKMEIAGIDRIGGALYSYWPVNFREGFNKEEDTSRSIENVIKLADIAADYGVTLNMEVLNRFEGYMLNVCDEAVRYVGVIQDPRYHTTLGFVQLDHKGDRSFSFYRDPGADLMLTNEEVPNRLLQQCSIFHFGSLSMTDEPCRSATLEAAQTARSKGAIITYDPNYRDPLWESEAKAKEYILNAMPLANILKVSEEEMLLLTGKTDLEIGAEELSKLGPSIIFVTLGSKGSFCYTKKFSLLVPAYKVCTVDTTGAGDAFFGALLWQLKGKTLEEICEMQRKDWEETLSFANAAGGLTTQVKGAMPAMPDFDAIMTCVHSGNIF